MALADATLVIAATAARDSITHFQLHSANPGAAGTTSPVGTRVATSVAAGTIDADGDITWPGPYNFTGLTANQSVTHVSYWSAVTGGDTAANAAGEYTISSVVENFTAA